MKRSLILWEYLFFLAKWSLNLIYFSLRSHRWTNIEIPYNQDSVTQTLSHFLILRIQGGLLLSIPDMYFIFIHSDFNSTPVIWTQVISCHCLGSNLSDIYIMIIVRSETALLTSHIKLPRFFTFPLYKENLWKYRIIRNFKTVGVIFFVSVSWLKMERRTFEKFVMR